MLTRLSKAKRRKAGWLIALAYLLCVLGPGVAYAIGGNQLAAPCFSDDHVIGAEHAHHMHFASAEMPVEAPTAPHNHAVHHPATDDNADHRSHEADGKPAHGLCCAMMCTSGLPANVARDIMPVQPTSICALEPFRSVTGQGPARLYRPPIV